jgi:trimeric autotransporter adhesin
MAFVKRELGKTRSPRRTAKAWMLLSVAALAGARAALGAGVVVDHVAAGSAQFQQSGANTIIHAANHTIIDYSQFNIAAGAKVQFIQPTSKSWVLNRIVTASPTTINGTLSANGMVYLVNPAGVMFGPNSIINVGQLYAAAAHISDQEMLAGINHFTGAQGSVVNQGKITAADVYLVGLHVVNGGSIIADSGTVAMVAGHDVYLGNSAGGLLVKVDGAAVSGNPSGIGVDNPGSVDAQVADMSAGDLYSIAIRQTGRTKAANISLDGGKTGIVQVSGTLDASNPNPGETGGSVHVIGDQVFLSDATVNASGEAGGGTIWIGGGPHGAGTAYDASDTLIDNHSILEADALVAGNGGNISVWSDTQTVFDGAISLRGGALAGNGGFAEVSSAESLGFAGDVNATAPHGSLGTLLLDPHTITVASGGAAQLTDVASFSSTSDETIDAGTIDSASADVVMQANTDILINQSINITTSGVSLTMQAGRSIIFGTGESITTNDGDVSLTANDDTATVSNRDGGTALLTMGSTNSINANGGNISMTVGTLSGSGDMTVANLTTTGSVTLTNSDANVNIIGPINAGSTDITAGQINLSFASTSASPVITTSGGQTFNSPVVLTANTAISDNASGDISFNSTIDGAFALTVNTAGTTTLAGAVGGTTPITVFTSNDPTSGITGGTLDLNAAGTAAAPSVVTTGGQFYNSPITLGANTVLTDKGGGEIDLNTNVDGTFAFTVNTAGTTLIAGFLGDATPLGNFTTNDPASGISGGTVEFTAAGTSSTPNVGTAADQTYNNQVVLGADAQLITAEGGNVIFNSTVNGDGNGPWNLTIDTSFKNSATGDAGSIVFGNGGPDYVGAVHELATLTTIASGGTSSGNTGTTLFNMSGSSPSQPAVTTSGNQTYNNPVVLEGDTALRVDGGGSVGFSDTVNGNGFGEWNLWIDTSFSGGAAGGIEFGNGGAAYVGAINPLRSLTTTASSPDGDGSTEFDMSDTNSPTVTTLLAQTYNNPVTFPADGLLVAVGNATGPGSATFNSTVDGSATNLSIVASYTFSGAGKLTNASGGNITFGNGGADFVGATSQFATLATTSSGVGTGSSGNTMINIVGNASPSIETTGDLTFNNPVVLAADTDLKSTTGGIAMGDSTTGLFNLTLDTTGGQGNIGLNGPATVESFTADAGFNIIANAITAIGTISLQPNSTLQVANAGPGDNRPVGVTILDGNLTSTTGAIDLSTAGRGAVPSVATIASNPQAVTNLTIRGQSLTMGQNEKLTVLGNLTIGVTGAAILGDINAGGSLNVTAGSVNFLRRPSGQVLSASDTLDSIPSNFTEGVDVIALGSFLAFNTPAITASGSGANPGFFTVTGRGLAPGFTVQQYSTQFGSALTLPNSEPLDLLGRPFIPETLATSLPPDWPPLDAAPNLYVPVEQANFSAGLAALWGIAGESTGLPTGTIAQLTQDMQFMYCTLVAVDGSGKPIYSSDVDSQKIDSIRKDFSDAMEAYRNSTHVPWNEPSAVESFLQGSSNPAAVRTFARLKRLKNAIQILANSSLSSEAQERFALRVVQPIVPPELTYDDVVQIMASIGTPRTIQH